MSVVFDPHESVANNVQVKEPHTLAASGPRFVFPKYGSFFIDSLEVWNGTTKLKESTDYYITHPYSTGVLRTGRIIRGGIWIINDALRTVQLTYHPVGINIATAAQFEAERLLMATVNPSERYYEHILGSGSEHYFPPVDVQYDWNNWCGEQELMNAIKGVADSLSYVPPTYDPKKANPDLVGTMRGWLIELRRIYEAAPAHAHKGLKNNPHLEDYAWIGALKRNGLAADTTKAYNQTLAQLVLTINNQLPSLTTIAAQKMLKTGGALTGPIITAEGSTKFSRGPTDTAYDSITKIDKAVAGSVAKANITGSSSTLVTFQAGNGSLILYPDVASGLKWNGKKILTTDTIGPYVPIGGAAAQGFYAASTTSVTITGKGIGSNPFVATWNVPSKTDPSALALRRLTSDFGYSETLAATPALIKKLDPYFTGKLSKSTAKINGTLLDGAIVLSKTMFTIDKVPNIADTQMPLSTAMETLIQTYEDEPDHVHAASMFGIVNATTTVKGLVKLGKKSTASNLALDASEVIPELQRVTDLETLSLDILQPGIIRIVRYGDSGTGLANVATYNATNYVVTLASNKLFYLEGKTVPAITFNLAELFPLDYENNRFYVYVDIINGTPSYDVTFGESPENEIRTKIGYIETDFDGVIGAFINNVTRLGMFRQLEEHMAAPEAHIQKFASKNFVGLDLVVDAATKTAEPALNNEAAGLYATVGWMIDWFSPLARMRITSGAITDANYATKTLAQLLTDNTTTIHQYPTLTGRHTPSAGIVKTHIAVEGKKWTAFSLFNPH